MSEKRVTVLALTLTAFCAIVGGAIGVWQVTRPEAVARFQGSYNQGSARDVILGTATGWSKSAFNFVEEALK